MTLFELFRGYIYNQDNSFSILLMNLFKQRYISSVKRCYYLNKFISSAFFYEHYVYVDNTFKEVKKKNQKKKNTHCTISHVIARLTIFTYAFCHMRVENLMKESGLHYSVFLFLDPVIFYETKISSVVVLLLWKKFWSFKCKKSKQTLVSRFILPYFLQLI